MRRQSVPRASVPPPPAAVRVRSLVAPLVVALAAGGLLGCFELEQTIELQRDLSGTADVSFTLDMEPMAYMAAAMKKGFAGEEGPPTEEEIAAARAEMLAESESKVVEPEDMEAEKRKLAESLPEGVELVDVTMQEEGLKVLSDFALRFDHASRLAELEATTGTGPEGQTQNPFLAIQFEDEGDTFVLRTPESTPQMDQMSMMMGGDEDEDPAMAKMFEGMRIAVRVKAPFEVVETNATRREGDTLIWEQDFARLSEMAEAEEPAAMLFVRYRK
jgi:hypothetical protein